MAADRLIALLPPPTRSRHRPPYPYPPAFLSHFPALVIRAPVHTLDVPDHPAYVLDTRHADHARAEVLLRRHRARLHAVLAAGRFPHHAPRLAPLLVDLPVYDVRATLAPVTAPSTKRPPRYLLTRPLPDALQDPLHAGWCLPPADFTDLDYFTRAWLPLLQQTPTLPVVLQMPLRDPYVALYARYALTRTPDGLPGDPDAQEDSASRGDARGRS